MNWVYVPTEASYMPVKLPDFPKIVENFQFSIKFRDFPKILVFSLIFDFSKIRYFCVGAAVVKGIVLTCVKNTNFW